MRLKIHRGSHEIGGSCVELEAQGQSILLDLGLPLDAAEVDPSLLPQVPGLTDGCNPNLLGILLSHIHGDHNGLTGLVHKSVPVFMGRQARSILLASEFFVRQSPVPPNIQTYGNQTPFNLGPFRITPFLTDHSAFDAYSLMVEADNKCVLYSGDLRAHGRKASLVEDLLAHPPPAIDCLMLEGTTLSRAGDEKHRPETEGQLEDRVLQCIKQASGLVLAAFSPQNVDRFVTVFKATKRAGRTFISDLYLARLLDALDLQSLPSARDNAFRVYLPGVQKQRIMREQAFELAAPYRSGRIFAEEIAARPSQWVMLFRESMLADVARMPTLRGTTLIYSLWPGYLDRPRNQLRAWCEDNHIDLEICHTSGHADPKTLVRIAEALKPRIVVPIHTEAADLMSKLIPATRLVPDGMWMPV
jgi:ribonuclease J